MTVTLKADGGGDFIELSLGPEVTVLGVDAAFLAAPPLVLHEPFARMTTQAGRSVLSPLRPWRSAPEG